MTCEMTPCVSSTVLVRRISDGQIVDRACCFSAEQERRFADQLRKTWDSEHYEIEVKA